MALLVVLEAIMLVGDGVQARREEDNLGSKDGELSLFALGNSRLGGGSVNAAIAVRRTPSSSRRKGEKKKEKKSITPFLSPPKIEQGTYPTYRPGKPTIPTISPLLKCSCCASKGTPSALASCAWHITCTLTPSFLTS